jgi:uncharacterized protein (DUF58 family)
MRLSMRDWRLPALSAVALVFARMSEGQLPYFIFYLSTGLVLLAYLWTRHLLQRVDCTIEVQSDRTEVGQSLWVKVRLDNDTFLPLPWVEVDDATPQHLVRTEPPHQATAVPSWGSRLLTFHLTARRRGHYAVGPIRMTLGDALGLFQGYREFQSRTTITVYPRMYPIEGLPIPLSQPFGPVRTRERAFEDPSNQAEIRKYRPGDNPRHIHWKTSARVGELMLREYELNASTQMVLFPDMAYNAQVRTAGPNGPSTDETVVEVTASLAALGLRRKIDVGLICHGQERFAVTPGHGQRAFHEILEVLARVEAEGRLPIEQVLEMEAAQLPGRSTLVVVTPMLTGRLADVLLRLRANHQLMLVLLRRETFLPVEAAQAAAAESQSDRSTLTSLLAFRRIPVYLLGAHDDIRRLAEFRLVTGPEGVRVWSPGVHPSVIRS